jgi:hypothetical protein
MDRIDPPLQGSELDILVGFLNYHRGTLAWKCEGLGAEQLCARPIPTTSMSLLGLVRHLADVERSWFQRCVGGVGDDAAPPIFYDPNGNIDGDFHDTDPAHAEADLATGRAEILAAVQLDDVRHHGRWGKDLDVRWVVVHMIEEYARHNGHADLLREAIDGATGE